MLSLRCGYLMMLPVLAISSACGGNVEATSDQDTTAPAAIPTESAPCAPGSTVVPAPAPAASETLTPSDLPDLSTCLQMPSSEERFETGCAIDAEGAVHPLFTEGVKGITTLPSNIVWIVQKFAASYTVSPIFPEKLVGEGADANLRVYQSPGRIQFGPGDSAFPEDTENNRVAARALRMDKLVVVKVDGAFTPGNQMSVFASTSHMAANASREGYIWTRLYFEP